MRVPPFSRDRKSTRLNSSHTVIYTLSLHDALPIFWSPWRPGVTCAASEEGDHSQRIPRYPQDAGTTFLSRSEEHTSELQSHSDLHSFPTRRSSDLLEPVATRRNLRGQRRRRS